MQDELRDMRAVDTFILQDLLNEQPDYIPLVANRLGLHLAYVESRCDLLIEYDLIQPVTDELVYTVTARGEAYLTGDLEVSEQTQNR